MKRIAMIICLSAGATWGDINTKDMAQKQKQEMLAIAQGIAESMRSILQSVQDSNKRMTEDVARLRNTSKNQAAKLDQMEKIICVHAEAVRAEKAHVESYERWSEAGFPTSPDAANTFEAEAFEKELNTRTDPIFSWLDTLQNLERQIRLDLLRVNAIQSKTPPVSLSGHWTGIYSDTAEGKETRVPFIVQFTQDGEKLTGMVTEANTFDAEGKTAQLKAAIENGVVIGNHVEFDKRYSGSGGYSHAVRYAGDLDAKSKLLKGKWTLKGNDGWFQIQIEN